MNICRPKFRDFPWAEYPDFCHQLKQYGLTDQEAYLLCETGSENLYYTNKENGWNNLFIETRLSPKKTFWNKVGEFFSAGTDCTCCLGYRIGLASFVAVVGWIAFFIK